MLRGQSQARPAEGLAWVCPASTGSRGGGAGWSCPLPLPDAGVAPAPQLPGNTVARPWEPPSPGEHQPRVWRGGRRVAGGASPGVTLLPGGTPHITGVSQADVGTYRGVARSVASTWHSQEAQQSARPGESAGTGQGAGCGAIAAGSGCGYVAVRGVDAAHGQTSGAGAAGRGRQACPSPAGAHILVDGEGLWTPGQGSLTQPWRGPRGQE